VNDNQHNEALVQARLDITRLEVQVTYLSASTARLEESNQQLTEKLDQVLLTLSEARGGWRTMMILGGAMASVGAGLSWLAQHFWRG
jgi:hypothetical protein